MISHMETTLLPLNNTGSTVVMESKWLVICLLSNPCAEMWDSHQNLNNMVSVLLVATKFGKYSTQ